MWEQNRLSLFSLMQVLLTTSSIHRSIVSASSSCSNSFRFDQLCPDPRFGSREPSVSTNYSPDTNIQLNSNGNNRRPPNGYGGRAPSIGTSYSSSMLTKDPSTSACDFHLNGIETAVVAGVHVTENPWDFRHANTCNHIVKISYDLFDGTPLTGAGVSNSNTKNSKAKNKQDRVCRNEIGIRRHAANENHQHLASALDEELQKKLSVYFWHNFTVYSHSAEFTDTLTNYHLSRDDISCRSSDKKSGQYVQIAIVVSKSGRCEIIVQQYKLETNRSPWGCTMTGYPIPYPIQFCGTYECSQINSILTGLKLLSRRTGTDHGSDDDRDSRSIQTRTEDVHIKTKGPPPLPEQNQQYEYSDEEHYDNGVVDTTLEPCSTTPAGEELDEEEESNSSYWTFMPKTWHEAVFLFGFPLIGIFFIVFISCILRTRNGREICRGYPYEGQRHSVYQPASDDSMHRKYSSNLNYVQG